MVAEKSLIVIVGPTASGKTNLAINLSKKFNGEIISADSRAIYRGLDIGTAKPTADEQKAVQHWGIDLVEPNQRFTVADFQKYAEAKIAEIRARGKRPFLVGGSGLYIDSVIFNYEFGGDKDDELREKLNQMTIEELQDYCKRHNIPLPENRKNKRYLVRTIERQTVVRNTRQQMRDDAIIVGLKVDENELKNRITARAEQMVQDGLIDETRRLVEKYGANSEPLHKNEYGETWRFLTGETDNLVEQIALRDRQLVKKQMTWFRRNTAIEWLTVDEIEPYLNKKFAQKSQVVVK